MARNRRFEQEEIWQFLSVLERRTALLIRGQMQIMKALNVVANLEIGEMFDVQRLVDSAKRQTDATKAMKEAFDKVVAELRAAQDDPKQLEEALSAFEANTAVIAAASTYGTPADTGQPVPPVVPSTGGQQG
jgi:hypothetical protein